MPALLRRQLSKLELSEEKAPNVEQWRAFLVQLQRTYAEAEQDRYTLERSMMVSSREMQDLHDQLRRSEENFRVVAERIPDGVFVQRDGLIRYANPAMASMLAIGDPGELIGKDPFGTLAHPDDRDAARDYARRRAAGELVGMLSIRWVRSDGSAIFVEVRATQIAFDGQPSILVIAHDITDRLRAQAEREHMAEALRENELRFRRLFESGMLGIIIADRSGSILEANDAFLELVGHTREDLLAGTLAWEELTPPEWRHLHAGVNEQLEAQGWARPWEKEYLRKDGSRVPVLVGVAMLEGNRNISFSVDLSEKRRAETEHQRAEQAHAALEDQLRQSQKMQAIGSLAGGVAHDFNNLLSVILTYSEMLAEDFDATDPIRANLDEIHAAGVRASELTRQLLAFSRRQVLQPRLVDLNELVNGMKRMLQRLVREDVELTLLLSPSLPRTEVDPGQIEQVIVNLAVNARDAMPEGEIGRAHV